MISRRPGSDPRIPGVSSRLDFSHCRPASGSTFSTSTGTHSTEVFPANQVWMRGISARQLTQVVLQKDRTTELPESRLARGLRGIRKIPETEPLGGIVKPNQVETRRELSRLDLEIPGRP
jgi:hypothetical protein